MRLILLTWLCFGLAACGVDYDSLGEDGKFTGSVIVLWVDGGINDGSGDGKFIYLPTPGDELKFVRPGAKTPLVPGAIYTDGGSIPRSLQAFRGLNPWGYAPAYVLHDWLFVAKRCFGDKHSDMNEEPVSKMKFIESAEIMGEALKALTVTNNIKPQDDAGRSAITLAVSGPVSRKLWRDSCKTEDRLNPVHREKVKAYVERFTAEQRLAEADEVDALKVNPRVNLERQQTTVLPPAPSGVRAVGQIALP